MRIETTLRDLNTPLKDIFGYNTFRPYQETIIQTILDKKDLLAILPTGSGKSLCYQLPAIIMPGTVIVISPLISLMQDQVDQLTALGIKATCLNSALDRWDQAYVLDQIDQFDLVYMAPERLKQEGVLARLKKTSIPFIVVDEAHCISQWGHAFRPEYRQLAQIKDQLNCPVVAFTATATPKVAQDICDQLALINPTRIIGSFDRPNLFIRIQEREDEDHQIQTFLNRFENESGIIYAPTRKAVDALYTELKRQQKSVGRYHAGMSDKEREEMQRLFLTDKLEIMVATVAFGMGVHKPNIRFVLHTAMPQNIEQYYQEIGRAGRDALSAECLLLFSTQDLVLQRRLQNELPDPMIRQEMFKKSDQMAAFCNAINCRRKEILNYFGEVFEKENCNCCDVCLDEIKQIDGTEIAQKILSCVYRLNQSFGVGYVCDVLVGAKTKNVLQRGHDQISTYGILSDLPKKAIRQYIYSLVHDGALSITDGQYPVIQFTDQSKTILSGTVPIYFRQYQVKKSKHKDKLKEKFGNFDQNLFAQLSAYRREVAEAQNVAPYIIFFDRTLMEMARYYPVDPDCLILISGVGQRKLNQYGDAVLSIIKQYCDTHGISPNQHIAELKKTESNNISTSIDDSKSIKGDTLLETLRLLMNGKTLEDIAKDRQLSIRTIQGHVAQLIERQVWTLPDNWLSSEKYEAIRDAILIKGDEKLTPIKEYLGDNVDWHEIQWAIAKFRVAEKSE